MPGYNAENPAVKDPYAVSTLGSRADNLESTHEVSVPKPEMEGKCTPANMAELLTPIEKGPLNAGKGWHTRRPKAGA